MSFRQTGNLNYRCSLKYAFTLIVCSGFNPLYLQKLSSVSCSERDFTYTAAKSSPTRNRVTAFLPRKLFLEFNIDMVTYCCVQTADSARISLLRFHGSSDYINACFIDVSVLYISK